MPEQAWTGQTRVRRTGLTGPRRVIPVGAQRRTDSALKARSPKVFIKIVLRGGCGPSFWCPNPTATDRSVADGLVPKSKFTTLKFSKFLYLYFLESKLFSNCSNILEKPLGPCQDHSPLHFAQFDQSSVLYSQKLSPRG